MANFLRFINTLHRLRLRKFELRLNFTRNDNYHKSTLLLIDNNFIHMINIIALFN
jgi:hypothetical protein